jgi:ABC-2 type transport system ATP-binding protein
MSAAIEAHNLRRKFGENEAVAGVNLAVQPGEIYGFLGPNGAGKSTMVKMLCTLLTPTSGRATVAGFDVASQAGDIRLRIGVALQDSSIDGKQSGREMLHLQGELYGLSKSDIKQRMGDVIGLVDIGSAIDDRVETYSGGMKRRLDLAMSLIHKPQILFLDEPTTGLDPASRTAVWNEVRKLNREEGMTIFLTTQYLEEADELADRVGIISAGKIETEGTPTAGSGRRVERRIAPGRVDRVGHKRCGSDRRRRCRPQRKRGHSADAHVAYPHPR